MIVVRYVTAIIRSTFLFVDAIEKSITDFGYDIWKPMEAKVLHKLSGSENKCQSCTNTISKRSSGDCNSNLGNVTTDSSLEGYVEIGQRFPYGNSGTMFEIIDSDDYTIIARKVETNIGLPKEITLHGNAYVGRLIKDYMFKISIEN